MPETIKEYFCISGVVLRFFCFASGHAKPKKRPVSAADS